MNDVISEYQRWKEQGENLRLQAKQAMEARFRDLLAEAVHIAEEYRRDFGAPLKPPSPITSFRYKSSGRSKGKKSAKTVGAKSAATKAAPLKRTAPAERARPDPKIAGLQKRLATTRKKLEDAKTAGAPTRNLEDKIYEIEDEIRLATQA